MRPNAKQEYNPDPQYIAELIGSLPYTQPELAKILGCNDRTLRRWLTGQRQIPYVAQFTLESLVLDV